MSSKLADQLRRVFDEAYLPPRGDLRVRIGLAVGAEQPPRRSRTGRLAASLAVGIGTALVIALAIAVPRIIGAGRAQPSQPRAAAAAQTPRPSPSEAAVPWIDTPAGLEPTPTPLPTPSSPPAGLQVCRSRDLIAHPGPGGGGLGHYGAPLIFTDRAATPCTLSGFPTSVRFLDAKGHRVTEYRVALADGGYIPSICKRGCRTTPRDRQRRPERPRQGANLFVAPERYSNLRQRDGGDRRRHASRWGCLPLRRAIRRCSSPGLCAHRTVPDDGVVISAAGLPTR